jgi:hypothetical protein
MGSALGHHRGSKLHVNASLNAGLPKLIGCMLQRHSADLRNPLRLSADAQQRPVLDGTSNGPSNLFHYLISGHRFAFDGPKWGRKRM